MPIATLSAPELARISRETNEIIRQLSVKEGTQSAMKNIPMLVDDCLFHARKGKTEKNHTISIPNTAVKQCYHDNKSSDVYEEYYDVDKIAYEEAYVSTIVKFFSQYGYRVYVSKRDEEESRIILTISWEGAEEND